LTRQRPPIDVITVNYDAGESLLACVRSVLGSSVPTRVWVVDNASTDGSVERLESELGDEPRLTILRNPENLGFARANNQILQRSLAGEYALLLNPDCVVETDTLGSVARALDADPGAGMAGCLLLGTDGREQVGCRRETPTPRRALARAFGLSRVVAGLARALGRQPPPDFVLKDRPLPSGTAEVGAISGAFMLVRAAALEAVGPLDEGYFLHAEDLDWCLRFRRFGWRILFVPGARAVHEKGRCSRAHPFRVQWHLHRGMTRYYLEHHRRGQPWPLVALVWVGIWTRFALLALPGAGWAASRNAWDRLARRRPG
jgi:hypothetical protein